MRHIHSQLDAWSTTNFTGTYRDAKRQALEFTAYKQGLKREWVKEKTELGALLGNIRTKLKTYELKTYTPPIGFGPKVSERLHVTVDSADV